MQVNLAQVNQSSAGCHGRITEPGVVRGPPECGAAISRTEFSAKHVPLSQTQHLQVSLQAPEAKAQNVTEANAFY